MNEENSKCSEKASFEENASVPLDKGCYGCLLIVIVPCLLSVLFHSNVLCALFGCISLSLYLGGSVLQKTKPDNKSTKEAIVLGQFGITINALVGYLVFYQFLVLLRSFAPTHAIQYIFLVIIKVLVVYIPISIVVRKLWRTK